MRSTNGNTVTHTMTNKRKAKPADEHPRQVPRISSPTPSSSTQVTAGTPSIDQNFFAGLPVDQDLEEEQLEEDGRAKSPLKWSKFRCVSRLFV
jgi:hypothetical protein